MSYHTRIRILFIEGEREKNAACSSEGCGVVDRFISDQIRSDQRVYRDGDSGGNNGVVGRGGSFHIK